MSTASVRSSIVAVIAVVVAALCAAPVASADLAPGTWVFDSAVRAITQTADATYVGGSFWHEERATGPGVVVPATANGIGPVDDGRSPVVVGVVLAVVDDGAGGWYVGGHFTRVGQTAVRNLVHIAADGTVDPGFRPEPDGTVRTLQRVGGVLYAGGLFAHIGGHARPGLAAVGTGDGSAIAWTPQTGGDAVPVRLLAVAGGRVYIAGDFMSIGGAARYSMAAFDDTTGALTSFAPDPGRVTALQAAGGIVYVGGGFQTFAGAARNGAAAVNASTGALTAWAPQPTDNGFASGVSRLVVHGSVVYLGGSFDHAGGQARPGLAAVRADNGQATAWQPPAAAASLQTPWVLAATDSAVYVRAGTTLYRGDAMVLSAADGHQLDGGPDTTRPLGGADVADPSGGRLYLGGQLASAGEQIGDRHTLVRVRRDGTLDGGFDPSPDSPDGGWVEGLAEHDRTLYAVGNFTTIGGKARNGLAALDPLTGVATAWNPNPQSALFNDMYGAWVFGSTLYVSGTFDHIAGQPRKYVASFDLTTGELTAFHPDPDQFVTDIAVDGNRIYLLADRKVLEYDATTGALSSWHPNAFGSIDAIAAGGGKLYVGGDLETLDGQQRENVGAYDEATHALTGFAPQLDGPVASLKVAGNTLYAGGAFSHADGLTRSGLAAIDLATGHATGWDPAIIGLREWPIKTISVLDRSVAFGTWLMVSAGDQLTGNFARLDDTVSAADGGPTGGGGPGPQNTGGGGGTTPAPVTAAGSGPPATVPPPRARPTLPRFVGTPRIVRGRRLVVKLRCAKAGSRCTGYVVVRWHGRRVGRKRFSLAAGRTATVSVALDARTRRLLARPGRKAGFVVSVTSA